MKGIKTMRVLLEEGQNGDGQRPEQRESDALCSSSVADWKAGLGDSDQHHLHDPVPEDVQPPPQKGFPPEGVEVPHFSSATGPGTDEIPNAQCGQGRDDDVSQNQL
jgi:hypothetical protein